MEHLCSKGKESIRDQRGREMARTPLQVLHDKVITQTTADDLFQVLSLLPLTSLAQPEVLLRAGNRTGNCVLTVDVNWSR